jgi:hypothetical protein
MALSGEDRRAFADTWYLRPVSPHRALGAHLRALISAPGRYLMTLTTPNPDFVVLADLLSMPTARGNLQSSLAPQRLKEMIFAAIVRKIESLAASAPVLAVVEDIQWADPTTLDLLDLLISTVERWPMLLIVTSRPGIQPSWVTRAHVTMRLLTALDNGQAATLIGDVSGAVTLPLDVVNRIIAHADGVPLYIEELTKTVMERGSLGNDGERLSLIEQISPDVVPTTLNASLIGRLDRLAAGKEVAQIGSVIGREFSFEMLQDLSGLPAKRLHDAVRELVQAEITIERGRPPDATYTFKHALVQDAAYDSLLKPLLSYSLIEKNRDTFTYSMHRMVQSVQRHRLKEQQHDWAERVVRTVDGIFPFVEFTDWSWCNRLLPHTLACLLHARKWKSEIPEVSVSSMPILRKSFQPPLPSAWRSWLPPSGVIFIAKRT